MAKKDLASEILNQIENGTRDIYNKYQSLINASKTGLDTKQKEIDDQYDKAKSDVRANAKITLQNDLEALADKGLGNSGQAMQTRISSNAAQQKATSTLEAAKLKAKSDLINESEKNALELDSKMQSEINSYKQSMYKEYLSQLEKDRNYEYKTAQSSVKASSSSGSGSKSSSGSKPSKNAGKLLEEIVENNTYYYKKKGYKVIKKGQIKKALETVFNDKYYSDEYKLELRAYAAALGYI